MSTYKIAAIPGDGIGKEVVPEGMRVLEAAGRRFNVSFQWQSFDWSCETYAKTGSMMPEDGIAQVKEFDAIYLGAVGFPGVADHVSLWGLLIPLRRELDLYANVRPVRLLKGMTSPLAGSPLIQWVSTSTSAFARDHCAASARASQVFSSSREGVIYSSWQFVPLAKNVRMSAIKPPVSSGSPWLANMTP